MLPDLHDAVLPVNRGLTIAVRASLPDDTRLVHEVTNESPTDVGLR